MKRFFALALILSCAWLPSAGLAQTPAKNVPYLELTPPQPTESQGRIEVVEFFWYGCPHCYALEPVINPWIQKLPSEVSFRRVPAIFNEQWGIAARVFYALEAINEEARVHTALFDAIHKEGLRITDESVMTGWLGKRGIDLEKYKAAYRSFGVESKLKRAQQMTQSYRIDGVPALAVQGRYVVSASMINDRQELLNATDQAIRLAMKQAGITPKSAAGASAAKSAGKSNK